MLKWLWRRRRLDEEFRSEIDAHLVLLIDRYVRSGMTQEAARSEAIRRFGNVTWHREELHLMNGLSWIDGLTQDLRYALRQVRHNAGFSAVVGATLALGIGGTTAVFSVMHAVLLAPLPYGQPSQLVRIYQEEPGNSATRAGVSARHFTGLRDHTASFADVGGRYFREDLGLDFSQAGGGQRLRTLLVTSDYFRALRAEPFRGPGFQIDHEAGEPGDDRIGARRVVLSDAVWHARFNGDPSIVGTTIRLSAEPYEIAGIAPAGFEDPVVGAVDAWLPYNLERDTLSENYSLTVVGRLRPGVSVQQALAELAVLSRSMKQRWPEVRASSIVAVPLQEDVVAPSRNLLQLLPIGVGLVLLKTEPGSQRRLTEKRCHS
jgi:putative ABC transport system permease protein